MKKISRRFFLSSLVAAFFSFYFIRLIFFAKRDGFYAVEDAIKDKLSYLKIDKSEIVKFLEKLYPALTEHSVKQLNIEKISGQCLLSSDFFLNNQDLGRQVKFTTLYNPSAAPCVNPFADFA